MQRTASLDALYQRPCTVFVSQQQQHQQHLLAMAASVHGAAKQLHKSTQTLESYLEHQQQYGPDDSMAACALTNNELTIEKVLRQRLQRTGSGCGGLTVMAVVGTQLGAGLDYAVRSQTHSPQHGKMGVWVLCY